MESVLRVKLDGRHSRSEGKKTEKGLKDLEKQGDRTAAAITKMGKEMKSVGSSMSRYLTLPILAAGGASIKMASDFDTSMTRMVTLVGVGREEVAGFREEILKLAPALGTGPRELGEAMFAITSAGQRGAKALNTLTLAAKASSIGMGDTRTVALAAVAAVQAYGEENLSTADSIDILIGTIEQGNLAAESLAPVLGRVIGVAAEMGVAFEDVGTFIATFSRLGVEASESATSLRAVLSGLLKATPETEKAFRSMNTTVAEFRDQIQDQGFTNAFQGLVRNAQRLGIDISKLVPEVRGLAGVLGVFGAEGTAAQDVLEGISGAVGTLEQRLKDLEELDPAFQIAKMRAELESLAIEIGTDVMPAFLGLVSGVRDLAKGFRELPPEAQTLTMYIGGLLAVLGPLLFVVGQLLTVLPRLVGVLAILSPVGALITSVALALALFAKNVNDIYVSRLENAIGVTGRFTTSLEKLNTVAGLQGNLDTINEQLDLFVTERESILDRIESQQTKRSENIYGSSRIDTAAAEAIAQEMEALAGLDRNIESHLKLRDRYIESIEETGRVLEEAGGTDPTAPQGISDEELERMAKFWQDLRGSIEPATVAVEGYLAGITILSTLLGEGAINQDQWAAGVKQLGTEMKDAAGFGAEFYESMKKVANIKLESLDGLFVAGDLKKEIDALKGGVKAWRDYEKSMFVASEVAQLAGDATQDQIDSVRDLAGELFDLKNPIDSLGDSLQRMGSVAGGALRDIQSSMSDGSKAYEALNVAIQAANVVQAIGAVLNQAQGDPYTAFARMASMAAAVAALGVSIGGFTGGFTDTSADRQASQGTGSVLGDAEAKSESILAATEITANATQELVGINRGMLNALNMLTQNIGSATGSIAQGGLGEFGKMPDTDLSGLVKLALIGPVGLAVDKLLGGVFSSVLNSILGGKSKITDEGIAILSGTLGDLIDGTLIKAFQEIQYKKWRFGSTKTKEELADLGDDAATQVGLIFQALGDAVREGALALGIDAGLIEERMAAFRVEEQRISLKDLSADEKAAEIQAVFSKIFDDLAGAVVPFIDQFQQVGEGLGETLIRVATSVQVMQEAVKQLGWAVDITDPEKYAQVAVGLVDMAGGIDAFISKFTKFVNKFATDEHKFLIASADLNKAFESVGLTLPETAAGLWDLMESLDATTEQGQRQIAMILELTDYAESYYNTLAELEQKRADALLHFRDVAESVISTFANLREMIVGTLSTPEQNYQRITGEAERLAALIPGMTDADEISDAVNRIDQLMRQAFGMLDPGQQQAIGQGFINFLDDVEVASLARIEELRSVFESTLDPMLAAAYAHEDAAEALIEAAGTLIDAADALNPMGGLPPGSTGAGGTSGGAVGGTSPAAIAAAVQAGVEAGMAIANPDTTSDIDERVAAEISNAIRSIPGRIVVTVGHSEFA